MKNQLHHLKTALATWKGSWQPGKTLLPLFIALVLTDTQVNAQVTFHLGNSLTDTNNEILPLITESAGKDHTYLRATIPGAPSDWVWDHPGESLGERDYRTVFANNVLDHLFTQPFASHCRSIENEADYSGRFFNLARQNSSQVQHWLYMQWLAQNFDDCWSRGEGGVDNEAASNWIEAVCNHLIYFEKVRDLMDQQQGGKSIRIMPSGLALAKLRIEMEAGRVPGLTDFATLFGFIW